MPARADRRRTHGAPRTSSRPPRPAPPAAKGAQPGARTGRRGRRAAALNTRSVPRREASSPPPPEHVAEASPPRRTGKPAGGILTCCCGAGQDPRARRGGPEKGTAGESPFRLPPPAFLYSPLVINLRPQPVPHNALDGVKVGVKVRRFLHVRGSPESQAARLLGLLGHAAKDDNRRRLTRRQAA